MTREDLGSYVRAGLLVEIESIQEPDIDQPVANDAPLPVSDVIEASEVAPEAAPDSEPVIDTAIVSEFVESVESVPDTEEQIDAESGIAAMTRSELWALIVEKGLDGGLEYRSTSKSKMISVLTEEG
jgi:hypothetical protein